MMRLGGEDEEPAEAHEINVTPFIDVMLVLLIIFMVAAPLATVDVAVDLPAATASPQKRPDKPVYVTVQADRELAVGDRSVGRDELAPALRQAGVGDGPVFVRADKRVGYGDLMEVLNLLRDAGFTRIALVGLDARQQP